MRVARRGLVMGMLTDAGDLGIQTQMKMHRKKNRLKKREREPEQERQRQTDKERRRQRQRQIHTWLYKSALSNSRPTSARKASRLGYSLFCSRASMVENSMGCLTME